VLLNRHWPSRARQVATRLAIATLSLVLIDASASLAQLRPDPDALALAPPELVNQLKANAYAYFRFVNRPWIARVGVNTVGAIWIGQHWATAQE
jgi:hypothetical protein